MSYYREGFGLDLDLGYKMPGCEDRTGDAYTTCVLAKLNPEAYAQAVLEDPATKAKVAAIATAQLRGLENDPTYGPVIAAALQGARDPAAVAARARALAAGFSADALSKATFELVYDQAMSGLTKLDAYMALNPYTASIKEMIAAGQGVFKDAKSWYINAERGGLDASGIIDGANIALRAIGAVRNVAQAFGGESATFNDVTEWAGVAVGCASSITGGAAVGGYIGAAVGVVACGVSVFTKLLGYFQNRPRPLDTEKTALGIFTPQAEQLPLIATDAARLAALLKYRYGVPSFASLIPHVAANHERLRAFPPAGTSGPVPAWTPTDILSAVSYFPIVVDGNVRQSAVPGTQLDLGGGEEGYARVTYGDISGRVVGIAIAKVVAQLQQKGVNGRWRDELYGVKEYAPFLLDAFSGAIHYSELLESFAAMIEVERAEGISAAWQKVLPVRLWAVGDGSATDLWALTSRYSESKWTRWNGGIAQGPRELVLRAQAGDADAISDLANIRLCAAFSYLHVAYHWPPTRTAVAPLASMRMTNDMVADLPVLDGAIPVNSLRVPPNPRWSYANGKWTRPTRASLTQQVRILETSLNPWIAKARALAESDFAGAKVAVAGIRLKAETALASKGTSTAEYAKALATGAALSASAAAAMQIAAARAPTAASVVPPVTTSSAVGTVIGIAALAALLKFLR